MKQEIEFGKKAFWFRPKGPEDDVVISSRVRLSRNLEGFAFPFQMSTDEEREACQLIIQAIRDNSENKPHLGLLGLDDLHPLDRKLLLERNLISQDFSLGQNKFLALSEDGSLSVLINETDHLKLVALKSGFILKEAYAEVDKLDNLYEQKLDYAVSLEFGYLGPSLTNIGTGLRASFMLHLPALVFTSLISKAVKTIASFGLTVKGFFSDSEESLGDLYQISNQFSIGMSENEIIEHVEEIVLQIVHYERRAREELLNREPIVIKDKIFRALGTLLYAKSISSKEAMSLLSLVRLGIALGLISGVQVELISSLFFLCQKYHIQTVLGHVDEIDSKLIDYTRAKLIRESFTNVHVAGGE